MEKLQIVYYTGTGSTRIIANALQTQLTVRNQPSEVNRLTVDSAQCIKDSFDAQTTLILVHAVHAFNAPDLVYTWLKSLQPHMHRRAMVISVSGGGEMLSNTACRTTVKRLLKKKGFEVVTEAMSVMPNNWMSPTPDEISKMLIQVVPQKVEMWLEAFLSGQALPYMKPLLIDHLITAAGRLEILGAKQFGKNIKASDACNGCGHCINNCPASNIRFSNETSPHGKPVFGGTCHFCLSCVYECPQHALSPSKLKFAVIPTGYPLRAYLNPLDSPLSKAELAERLKGNGWKGVRRYLEVE